MNRAPLAFLTLASLTIGACSSGADKRTDSARTEAGVTTGGADLTGAVAIAYNVPQVSQPLKLSGPVVADIFLGKITKWNDSRIASLNPGVTLPNSDVLVVHRSEGSGTTYIFSDYLSSVSAAWKSSP